MVILGKMEDLEERTKAVVERFALLIRQVIQKNLHRSEGIDLEDIEQEVRLRIWAFLKKGKKVENLPSYIKKVAYSTTIDELRKAMKQRPPRQPEDLKRLFSGASLVSKRGGDFSPEERFDEGETRETVWALVNTLSDNRKKVLSLFLLGLTLEEICESLKWEKAKVRHLFYRGIDDLKQRSCSPAEGAARRTSDGAPPGGRL
jgi:RNA polymerase sigma factor (sigma-70 family)